MTVILILMFIAMALVLYVAYLSHKKTKHFCLLFKIQCEEIDNLRDMIKGKETDAIIQLRGQLARLESEINLLRNLMYDIDDFCCNMCTEVEKLQGFKGEKQ